MITSAEVEAKLKNEDLKPSMFRKSSNHYVWWLCERGHEYKAKINNRVNGLGCPYCSGAKPLKGFNTLADIFPQILLEWDYEKNIKTPYDYLPSTKDKVFLICSKCGYKHESIINKVNRSFKSGNNGCPVCSKKVLITNVNDFKTKYPMLAQEWDYEKNKTKPEDYSASSIENVWWVCKSCNNSWLDTINHRVYRNSSCLFCSSRKKKLLVGFSDLATTNPEILNEWDYEKNIIKPQDVTNRSRKKVYWICNKGHSYYQEINSHIKGFGCKYCSGHDVLKGFNDLQSKYPKLIEEWNKTKNINITPDMIMSGTNKKVWWKCSECGKEWQSSICGRAANSGKTTCKGCSLRNSKRVYLRQGVNDLVTVCPKVAVEWDYEKNIGLAPNDVTAHSSQVVWWKCKNGHEWKASILNRTKDGYRGCPYCANRRVSEENNLQVVNPVVSKEWNYKKNGTLTPSDITANSNKKVWWICENGHEWQASPNNRMRTNCPYCANQKLWSGFNDLATKYPKLAEEWNYKRNGVLKPQDTMFGSTKKVWWIC